MIRMATKHAIKPIVPTTSFVPSATSRTTLGSFPGILSFQPNPQLFTTLPKPCCIGSIEPMGQPPIQRTRKLSPSTTFDVLQVFNDQRLNVMKVKSLDLMKHQGFDFSTGVLLSPVEGLDFLVGVTSCGLTIGSNQSVLVVGIQSKNPSVGPNGRAWLFQHEVNNDVLPRTVKSKTDRLPKSPSVYQLLIEMLSRTAREDHFGCSRSREFDSVIERTLERLHGHEMGTESHPMGSQGRLCSPYFPGGSDSFLGLFGTSLSKTSRDSKPIPSFMNRGEISEGWGKIPTLPEEIHKVLSDVVTEVKEGFDLIPFPLIQVGQENPRGSSHCWDGKMTMGFDHGISLLVRDWKSRNFLSWADSGWHKSVMRLSGRQDRSLPSPVQWGTMIGGAHACVSRADNTTDGGHEDGIANGSFFGIPSHA